MNQEPKTPPPRTPANVVFMSKCEIPETVDSAPSVEIFISSESRARAGSGSQKVQETVVFFSK